MISLIAEYGKPRSSTRLFAEAHILAAKPRTLMLADQWRERAAQYQIHITRVRQSAEQHLPDQDMASSQTLDPVAVQAYLDHLKSTVELEGALYEDAPALARAVWHRLFTNGHPDALIAQLSLHGPDRKLLPETEYSVVIIGMASDQSRPRLTELRRDQNGNFLMPDRWGQDAVVVDFWAGTVEPVREAIERYELTVARDAYNREAILRVELKTIS